MKNLDNKTFVVETKGLEDSNDPRKIKRLRQWCADVNATSDVGQSSLQVLGTDWETTRYIIEDIFQLLADRQKIERGRE